MKRLFHVLGMIAVVLGLLWAAQGSGLFPYPSSSFMINDTAWVYYGLATAFAGLVMLAMGRRRRR